MIPKKTSRLVQARPLFVVGQTLALMIVGEASGVAQVVLDGKFGTSGPLSGPNYTITAAMGAVRGNNLFQSFDQFNLAAGEVANFTGPANIQNILSRVTGANPSSIDGTIRSGIAGANFFFINPKGIIFGPNAAIDVSGAFAASTADYLKLADGAKFVAALDADDSGLSSAPVSAFGFLNSTPAGISVQQTAASLPLAVPDGSTLSLVGGDINITGSGLDESSMPRPTLKAAGGQVNLASVKSAGEVPMDPSTLTVPQFAATFPVQGQITLEGGARVDASGDGGGRIVIRGGSLLVDNSTIQANSTGTTDGQGIDVAVLGDLDLANGGQINSLSTLGLGAGGDINLNAGAIQLDGGGLVDNNTGYPSTQISTSTGDLFSGGGPARGGNIIIQTGSLKMVNSAQISSASFGAGNAGSIDITADSILLDALGGTVVQISANTQQIEGGGNAGDIVIHTGSLKMDNAATMLAATFGSGQAGLINIDAHSVNLDGSSSIIAATFGSGNGGDIQVSTETLGIDGQYSGIQAVTTSFDSPAPGGNIQISAGLAVLDHQGSVFTTSYGLGPGGNIDISAGNLTLANAASVAAAAYDIGPAGKISVSARQNILLTGGSAISTSAPGSSGGDITLGAGLEIRLYESQVNAQAGLDGGNITLSAPSLIYLLHSKITGAADTTGTGFGNGGNLTIDPSFLILNDGSLISKSSFGNGGNITILTDYFFQSHGIIDATAPFGLPGTVTVTAPNVDLSASVVSLPNNLLDAETLLRPDCGVRLGGNISSFIVLGSGGLPVAPGGFVPSTMPAGANDKK